MVLSPGTGVEPSWPSLTTPTTPRRPSMPSTQHVSVHRLQLMAPSAVNRGDDGWPKKVMVGGHARDRISAQCTNYWLRQRLMDSDLPTGVRTKLFVDYLAGELSEQHGRDHDEARDVVRAALQAVGFGFSEEDPDATQYMLFWSQAGIEKVIEVLLRREIWDSLRE